jgi:16S rRNA (guanine527-N7)-methyltransferase
MVNPESSTALPDRSDLWLNTLDWQPQPTQIQQFQQLYAGILAGNQQFNLTRITAPDEFWEKHLWDSLRGIRRWLTLESGEDGGDGADEGEMGISSARSPASFTVIDIGTGGGFPGVPVAIARPDWNVTLLDSTRKKIDFLDRLLPTLGITNTKTLVDRVEQVGQQPQYREQFDLALIRAVAAAPVCAEYALPLLKVGGSAILYRGQWTEAEAIALQSTVGQLGGRLAATDQFTTPLTAGERHCLLLQKIASTPAQYPRAVGVPSQKPIA